MNEPFHLDRFVTAQAPVYPRVLSELRQGYKVSHWMWFVFPQCEGLGSSWMAQKFAIRSRAEAAAYVGHPVLGRRLAQCTAIVNAIEGRTSNDIFGDIDTLKFRSSMTLFEAVAPGCEYTDALEKYFGSERDDLTADWLKRH